MDLGLTLALVLWFLGACHVGPIVWSDPSPPVDWKERTLCVGLVVAWPLLVVGALLLLLVHRS